MRGLLAEDILLSGLPILLQGQWLARISFPSQLRDSRGIAPLSASSFPLVQYAVTAYNTVPDLFSITSF